MNNLGSAPLNNSSRLWGIGAVLSCPGPDSGVIRAEEILAWCVLAKQVDEGMALDQVVCA